MKKVRKYKKGSAWKRANWDKWTFWKKVRHVLAVIASLITGCLMGAGFLVFVYFIMSISNPLVELRDKILLEIMHWLLG